MLQLLRHEIIVQLRYHLVLHGKKIKERRTAAGASSASRGNDQGTISVNEGGRRRAKGVNDVATVEDRTHLVGRPFRPKGSAAVLQRVPLAQPHKALRTSLRGHCAECEETSGPKRRQAASAER